jgi:acyl-CoA thioester hydrolase
MSISHSRSFRVRHYECDAYGHVNNVNYLRYMQETAFDAAAAVGYDTNYFDQSGYAWLVRETDIEYLQPLRYNETVTVKTWVEDFRRTRSRRVYLFTRNDETVARASTDWVYIHTATARPATIPPEMITAFGLSPEQEAAPRSKFPAASPPPVGIYKMRCTVQWRDLDTMGHVNNAVYLDYVGDCGIEVINAFGWSEQQMRQQGFGIVVKRHQIEYKAQALLGDPLEITTWVSGVRNASAIRHYQISRVSDGTLLVQVHSLCAWIDIATGRPIRIPPNFIASFAANISSEPAL